MADPHPTPSATTRKPPSLRLRLLAGAVIWIILSVLLAGWSLAHLFRQHATTQFRSELALHLNQLTAAFSLDAQGQPRLIVPLSDPRLAQPLSGLYWQIDRIDNQGRAVAAALRSRSLWDQAVPPPPGADSTQAGDVFYETTTPGLPPLAILARIVRVEDDNRQLTSWRLMIAADQKALTAPIAHFTNMLIVALGTLAVGMSLAALGLVMGGLRPLSLLRRRLADVHSGRTPGIVGEFPSEIQPLVDEFNAVLATNTEIVQRARTQAGNLAHAVKTPLTVLDNAARTEPGPLGSLVQEQVGLARRQVDYHLARARAAAAMQAGGMRTPLHEVLPALARTMRRLYAGRELDIQIPDLPPDMAFKGEAQDLHEMLGNLLDNACKWARQTVHVDVQAREGELTLFIDDDGPGLAPDERETVFQRGVRLDEQKPGSGLGLHIVAEMADLYQGSIRADASQLGGLRMILRLPAA